MGQLLELLDRLQGFIDRGGTVMPAILLLSVLMWALILERYWHLWFVYPLQLNRLRTEWTSDRTHRIRVGQRLRAQRAQAFGAALRKNLPLIRTFVQVLPLLGLLGTVTGMIQTFEVITIFGGSNRRGIAGGISEALLATLAGLVTALSGLYFSVNLEQRARQGEQEAARVLGHTAVLSNSPGNTGPSH